MADGASGSRSGRPGPRCAGPRRRRAWGLALAASLALGCGSPREGGFREVRRFEAPAARQGVAVDAAHVYAIASRSIEKYEKSSGRRVAIWEDPEPGRLQHLNSGVVLDGVLHCAHSNYPELPMESSIERFDAATLRPLERVDLGRQEGSATWVDRRGGHWWVGLAHYAGRGGAPGRGPEATRVVEFDAGWRPVATWEFPPEVVARFGEHSNSGGAWGPDGLLYATGHDRPELYALRLPDRGRVLELVAVVPAPIEGQGIAFDPSAPDRLYGIVKRLGRVVEARSPEHP